MPRSFLILNKRYCCNNSKKPADNTSVDSLQAENKKNSEEILKEANNNNSSKLESEGDLKVQQTFQTKGQRPIPKRQQFQAEFLVSSYRTENRIVSDEHENGFNKKTKCKKLYRKYLLPYYCSQRKERDVEEQKLLEANEISDEENSDSENRARADEKFAISDEDSINTVKENICNRDDNSHIVNISNSKPCSESLKVNEKFEQLNSPVYLHSYNDSLHLKTQSPNIDQSLNGSVNNKNLENNFHKHLHLDTNAHVLPMWKHLPQYCHDLPFYYLPPLHHIFRQLPAKPQQQNKHQNEQLTFSKSCDQSPIRADPSTMSVSQRQQMHLMPTVPTVNDSLTTRNTCNYLEKLKMHPAYQLQFPPFSTCNMLQNSSMLSPDLYSANQSSRFSSPRSMSSIVSDDSMKDFGELSNNDAVSNYAQHNLNHMLSLCDNYQVCSNNALNNPALIQHIFPGKLELEHNDKYLNNQGINRLQLPSKTHDKTNIDPWHNIERNENESFDRLNALVERVFEDIDLNEIYECTECGKKYSTSSNLARHRQIHRDLSDKKARKCPHCEKVYVSMPAFSMHVRTHSQGCTCPYCGKRFSRPWLLQGHIRTHTGEKPFGCPKCSKAFADKSNLRAHIQTHSTEKPYVCGRCGKAFALKSYLSKHEESSCMRGLKYHKLHCAFLNRNG